MQQCRLVHEREELVNYYLNKEEDHGGTYKEKECGKI